MKKEISQPLSRRVSTNLGVSLKNPNINIDYVEDDKNENEDDSESDEPDEEGNSTMQARIVIPNNYAEDESDEDDEDSVKSDFLKNFRNTMKTLILILDLIKRTKKDLWY